jgi:hypothetical protein
MDVDLGVSDRVVSLAAEGNESGAVGCAGATIPQSGKKVVGEYHNEINPKRP